ncbi:MAG: hydrophobic protein [Candidatus Dormibacteraeota bacterium]|nr:hydrophobic protein [Candidatus Dormibacteraeota bacterium]MBO0745975.1 hydrophobic protein [Candidatus Dormibacteraeota bacterium]
MIAVLILIAILILLGGGGILLHWLWIAAIVALIIWLIGFFVRTASGGGRWYRW